MNGSALWFKYKEGRVQCKSLFVILDINVYEQIASPLTLTG